MPICNSNPDAGFKYVLALAIAHNEVKIQEQASAGSFSLSPLTPSMQSRPGPRPRQLLLSPTEKNYSMQPRHAWIFSFCFNRKIPDSLPTQSFRFPTSWKKFSCA